MMIQLFLETTTINYKDLKSDNIYSIFKILINRSYFDKGFINNIVNYQTQLLSRISKDYRIVSTLPKQWRSI